MTTAAKPRARKQDREYWEQCELFRFLWLFHRQCPQFKWIHSSLNGIASSPVIIAKAKAAGLKPGVWDVAVPYPGKDGGFALFIEMKAGKNGLTPEQVEFQSDLEPLGYRFVVARSWLEAARAIVDYLGIENSHVEDAIRMNTKGVS